MINDPSIISFNDIDYDNIIFDKEYLIRHLKNYNKPEI